MAKTPAATLAAAVAASLVSARVLVDYEPLGLKVGHIVEGTQSQIDALVAGDIADAHPDAVAYAIGAGGVVVKLAAVAAAASAEAPAAADAVASAVDGAVVAAAPTDASAADPAPDTAA